MEYIIALLLFGAIYLLLRHAWKRDARRIVHEWCIANKVIPVGINTMEFHMGRPAEARIVGVQDTGKFRYCLTLHSSLLNMPHSLLQVWGKVKLREKYPVE